MKLKKTLRASRLIAIGFSGLLAIPAQAGTYTWTGTTSSNWDGTTTEENASNIAFYSTYGDTYGVPGDPYPHPTVEANYYINSNIIPAFTIFTL